MEAAEKLKISAENLIMKLPPYREYLKQGRGQKLRAVSILRKEERKKGKIEVPSVFKKSVVK